MTKERAIRIIEDYSDATITEARSVVNRGAVNQIYVLKTIGETYVLRTDLNEGNTNRFQKERWCAQAAREHGIASPEVFTVGLEEGHPYIIMSYVKGTNGDEATEEDKHKIWNILGVYARRIHAIPVAGFGEGMISPGAFKDTWSRYLDYNISSLTLDDKVIALGIITPEQSEQIKSIFLGLKDTNFKFGLTHDDLALKNTIITTSGETFLLDWGSAKVAPTPHLEITEILESSLSEHSHEFSLFLEGYGLTYVEYEQLKPDIARLSLLVQLDKLRWAIDRRKERIPHFSQTVQTKLTEIL